MNNDFFGALKKLAGSKQAESNLPSYIIANDVKISDKTEIISHFASHFFPPDPSTSNQRQQLMFLNTESSSKSFPPVHIDEILDAIGSVKCKSAPGEDKITAELIKLIANEIAPTLLKIINSCIALGYFPTAWKNARVCILKKAN